MMASDARDAPIATPAAATVFITVLTRGPMSRVDVARAIDLSGAAVTKAARPLIDAGYLVELPSPHRADAGAGRPANPLAIRADREHFVGIKVTADELIGVVTDLRAQVVTAQHRRLAGRGVEEVVDELAALAADLRDASPVRAHRLGVAVSGDVDRPAGLVRYSPFLDWHDIPLAKLVEDATGLLTTVENDVKALAVAEQWFGQGVGVDSFALVTIGAGIGCALVLGGRLVAGAHGVAGELGHLPVSDRREPCHCGASGCLEAVASTAALLTSARAAAGSPTLTIESAVERARASGQARRPRGDDRPSAGSSPTPGTRSGSAWPRWRTCSAPSGSWSPVRDWPRTTCSRIEIRASFQRQAFGAATRCALVIRPLPFEEWARGAAAVAIHDRFARN